ncbi:MAG: hypothetical protein ABIF82_01635 [Planctomycetota bacterium]
MGISDIQLDELQAGLDAGGALDRATCLALLEEARESRRLFGLATRAVGAVGAEALRVARRAEDLVECYREAGLAADDGPATITTEDWPHGFELPAADDA